MTHSIADSAADHMLGVGIGLQDVLALHVEAHEGAFDRGIEHVGNAQARLRVELDVPHRLELLAHRVAGDVAIAGQFVRERAHVAGALHVVLAAQRVHADAGPADIAGRHRQIGDRDDGGRALAVLGDAEAVIDRAVAAGGEQPRRVAQFLRIDAGHDRGRFRAVLRQRDEGRPILELAPVAALAHEGFVDEAFGDDDMRQRGEHGDVGAGHQRQMVLRLDMRRCAPCRCGADRSRSAWRPARSRFFRREANTGCASVGLAPMIMTTSVCSTESKSCVPAEVPKVGRQAIAGRRMADAGAGIDIVVAEAGADQLLHQIGFFVGAARRGDAADRHRGHTWPGCRLNSAAA